MQMYHDISCRSCQIFGYKNPIKIFQDKVYYPLPLWSKWASTCSRFSSRGQRTCWEKRASVHISMSYHVPRENKLSFPLNSNFFDRYCLPFYYVSFFKCMRTLYFQMKSSQLRLLLSSFESLVLKSFNGDHPLPSPSPMASSVENIRCS